MLKRRVFSVVLAVLMLMTFIACWTVQASASTTEGTTQVIWGQRGGGSAAFLHHNDVTGGAYRTIGVRFNALNAFDKIYIATGSTNKDITYTVYPWLGTYEMTKSGTPVAQVTETMTSNFVTVTLPTLWLQVNICCFFLLHPKVHMFGRMQPTLRLRITTMM